MPIGATTTSYTAIDRGGASVSFFVYRCWKFEWSTEQCDDDIATTDGDHCIDSQLSYFSKIFFVCCNVNYHRSTKGIVSVPSDDNADVKACAIWTNVR